MLQRRTPKMSYRRPIATLCPSLYDQLDKFSVLPELLPQEGLRPYAARPYDSGGSGESRDAVGLL